MTRSRKRILRVASLFVMVWVVLFLLGHLVSGQCMESFDTLLPSDALVYCSIQNLQEFYARWQTSPLPALVKDPVLSDALKKGGVDQWMRSQIPLAYRVRLPLEDIVGSFAGRMVVALFPENLSRVSPRNFNLLLLADYKGTQAGIESLINTCLPGMKEVARERSIVNGVTVYTSNYLIYERVSIPEGNSESEKATGFSAVVPADSASASSPAVVLKEYRYPISYAFRDSIFLFSLGPGSALKAVLSNWQTPSTSSLARKSPYQGLSESDRASADLFFYVNTGECFRLLENEPGSQHESTRSGGPDTQSLGFSGLQEARVWIDLEAQGLDIAQEILLARRESGISELLFPQSVDSLGSLGLTPPDAIAYRSFAWDCAAQWRALKKILRERWPKVFAHFSDLQQSLDAQFGFSLEQELLPVVRGECARYVRRSTDQGEPSYSVTYILDVSDAAQVERCVEKMLEAAKSLGLIQYHRGEYLEQSIFVIVPVAIPHSAYEWGVACLPTFCIASTSLGEVQEIIRRTRGNAGLSLSENAEIQRLCSRHPNNAFGLSYRVYEQATQLQDPLEWLKPLLSRSASSVVRILELEHTVEHQVLPRYFRKIVSLWTVTRDAARSETNIFYRRP